jgi:hypothetical protein
LAGAKAAIVTTTTKASATTRPDPIPFAREGRNKQHMEAIPKKERERRKSTKNAVR